MILNFIFKFLHPCCLTFLSRLQIDFPIHLLIESRVWSLILLKTRISRFSCGISAHLQFLVLELGISELRQWRFLCPCVFVLLCQSDGVTVPSGFHFPSAHSPLTGFESVILSSELSPECMIPICFRKEAY